MNDLAPSQRPTPVRVKRDEKVRRLCRRMFKECDWLKEYDRPAVRAWAELEILAGIAFVKLRSEGLLRDDGSGEVKILVNVYQRLRRTQLSFSKELGLTARARAEIASNSHHIPIDIESAAAERIEKLDREDADEERSA